jgi:hypothetical protein
MSKLVSLGWNDEKAYFFSGDQYVRWDIASDTVDAGYPRPISSGWIGIFADGIDAAAVWNNGKAYFFRGAEYSAYDIVADVVVDGYPRPIAENWPGVFPEGVDAVIAWGNGKAYFFRGDEYLSYDMATDTVDDGYPRPIQDGWIQPFDTGIDSAVVWNNGKAYFFRGDEYVRYDVATEMADEGYPQPISLGWPGARGERVPHLADAARLRARGPRQRARLLPRLYRATRGTHLLHVPRHRGICHHGRRQSHRHRRRRVSPAVDHGRRHPGDRVGDPV